MNPNTTYFSGVLFKSALILMLAFFLPACTQDDFTPAPSNQDNEAQVTIAIKVPGASTPATRALEEKDEIVVETVEVLVFEQGGGYKHTAYSSDFTPGPESNQQTFTVKLIKGNWDLMVLANSKEYIGKAFSTGIPIGTTQADVKASLLAEVNGKWDVDVSSNNYKHFPMWGELINVPIADKTSLVGDEGVQLARMLSRVDVMLTGKAPDNFKLQSIHVYNYNTHGTIAPLDDCWDKDELTALKPNVPTKSTLTKGPLAYTSTDDISETQSLRSIYLFEAEAGARDKLATNTCIVVGGMYNNESQPHYYSIDFGNTENNVFEYLALLRNHRYIVSITKVTGPGFPTEEDAFNSAPVNIDVKILKWNEKEMSEVVFDGQNYLSVSTGLMELSRAPYLSNDDKENQLIIKTDFVHNTDPTKSGWEIIDITETDGTPIKEDWISIAPENKKGVANVAATVPVLVKENEGTESRSGYIFIKAGSLEYRVTVEQSNILQPTLTILVKRDETWVETNQIRFIQDDKSTNPKPQTYKIKWFPKDMPIEIYLNKGDGGKRPVQWKSGQDPLQGIDNGVLTSDNGEVEFTVHPDMIQNYEEGSFDECQDLLQVRMNYTGDILIQMLQLQQFVKEIVIDANAVYTMDGEEHYVTVRSNVAWSIKPTKNISRNIGQLKDVAVVTNWEGVIHEGETGHKDIYKGFYNLPDGDKVHFRTVDDIKNGTEIFLGDISFEATSVEEEVELKAHAEDVLCASGVPQDNREANCYVLDPTSGAGILIPVHAANGVMLDDYKDGTDKQLYVPPRTTFGTEKIGKKTKFGAKLIWADNYGTAANGQKVGLAEDGMLYLVLPAGTGSKGYVLVMPGNPGKPAHMKKHGNAVVAVTSDPQDGSDPEVLWSWHVWVTDAFKYDTGGLMNGRILGGENSEELDHFGNPNNNAANWLDRNLGALTNNHIDQVDGYDGVTAAFGNVYQWGRKDPFPNTNITRKTSDDPVVLRPIYDEDGLTSIDFSHTDLGVTWTESIRNPSYFYYGTIQDKTNWNGEIDELWGVTGAAEKAEGAFQGKSIFDPCPAGWRLPTKNRDREFNNLEKLRNWNGHTSIQDTDNKWYDSEISGIIWGKTKEGTGEGQFHYKGGYYPFSGGYYSNKNGEIKYRGAITCFFSWTAGRSDLASGNVQAAMMYATSNGTAASVTAQVHNAIAARCVKDVLTPYK